MRYITFVFILLMPTICGAQSIPQLPNTSSIETCFPDTAGYIRITVCEHQCDFVNLQDAIDAAKPRTVILLQAGANYKGTYTLKKKSGEGWIIILNQFMDLLPSQGHRVLPFAMTGLKHFPMQKDAMPSIITTHRAGLPCIKTEAGAHHYRLVGLQITADTSIQESYGLVHFGDASTAQNEKLSVPHHLIIDRCYIHGHNKASIMKAGVLLNCSDAAIVDCHISEFHSIGYDTYAIGGTNGPGPFIIRNNYLEAAGENILFGGGRTFIKDLVPSDIEIIQNHFYKLPEWNVNHPDYQGKHWTIKNLFELKTGKRVLLEGNLMENSWADLPVGQSGYAILLTVRTEGGLSPQADISDVSIVNNIIKHCGAGISISGSDDMLPTIKSERILIKNNVFIDINGKKYGDQNIFGPNDGTFLKIGKPDHIIISHNTVLQSGPFTWMYDTVKNISITDNIFQCYVSDGGYQGLYGPGFAHGGNGPMARYLPGISDANKTFNKNVLVGGPAFRYDNYQKFSQNYFPSQIIDVRFENLTIVDTQYLGLRLSPSSPYLKQSTDGKDIGAIISEIEEAITKKSPCDIVLHTKTFKSKEDCNWYYMPSIGKIQFVSKTEMTDPRLLIKDSNGRFISVVRANNNRDLIFDISALPHGFYIMELWDKTSWIDSQCMLTF